MSSARGKSRKGVTGQEAGHGLYEDIYKDNFSFGENWSRFLSKMNPERIRLAKESISKFTGLKSLGGKTFIDLGCGSGLFSLAATRLGAKRVISVDIDDASLACTRLLKEKHCPGRKSWQVIKGSALDKKLLDSLPRADLVYSWGVLHHTGDMRRALNLAGKLVKKDGFLFVAIYNDFNGLPFSSRQWRGIKAFYNRRGPVVKWGMKHAYAAMAFAGLAFHLRNPFRYVRDYPKNSLKGMDFFVDIEDWLGGYPYEFASAEEIKRFYSRKGFELENIKRTKREGCNEFLFRKTDKDNGWRK